MRLLVNDEQRPHGHHHGSRDSLLGAVRTSPVVRAITLMILVLIGAFTALGLVMLWPDYGKVAEVAERASYQVRGVEFVRGEVLSLRECEAANQGSGAGVQQHAPGAEAVQGGGATAAEPQDWEVAAQVQNACQRLGVGLHTGADAGRTVDVTVRGTLALSGLQVGDEVELAAFPAERVQGEGSLPGEQSGRSYTLNNVYQPSGIERHLPLAIVALLFMVVVVSVGRIRGLFALVALGIAAVVLLGFMLPALVAGGPALLIGLVASSAILFVTLFFVHGLSMRTASALIGTLAGILIISGLSWVMVRVTRLSGLGDEASSLLSGLVAEIDFRGLLTCSILIAGLGVLNDVTITQASAVWELRAAAPQMSRGEIYARAMRIGRDHIASTVYTVVFAYTGAALSVLILLYLYNRPLLSLLTQEDIAIEIVRTMVGSIGLVLAVPITTAVAVLFVPGAEDERSSRMPAKTGASAAGVMETGMTGAGAAVTGATEAGVIGQIGD